MQQIAPKYCNEKTRSKLGKDVNRFKVFSRELERDEHDEEGVREFFHLLKMSNSVHTEYENIF